MSIKRILSVAISSVMLVPVISTAIVVAEDANNSTGTTTQTTTTTEAESNDSPRPDDKLLLARLEKRKTEQKTRLAVAEKLRIKTKCVASQGMVSSVKGRVKGIETSRTAVYKNIITHLTDLSAKLKDKGADTTALDADIVVLQGKMDTFNTDLTTYKQAVIDLAAMDCKADPDAFKASLEAARAALKKVNEGSLAIRGYIQDTIKPLLKTIRAELEAKETDNKTTEGEQ